MKNIALPFQANCQSTAMGIMPHTDIAKGMASSTAEVAASIEATALALGKEINKSDVARIALSIEPTDGCFFPGIVLFDHREGKLYESLGNPPPLDTLVLDFGGRWIPWLLTGLTVAFCSVLWKPNLKRCWIWRVRA